MILLMSSFESFIQLISVLLIFVFVLVLTYFTTKWIAGNQTSRSNNKNLHLIESINVGNSKFISIIQAGEIYLVVSVNKDDIKLLAQLSKEQLTDLSFELTNPKSNNDSFQQILNKFKDKIQQK